MSILKELENELQQFCNERMYQEPDTGAFVFDSDSALDFAEGFTAAIEIVLKSEAQPKIKLTKTLPNKEGWYYWFKYKGGSPHVGYLGPTGLFSPPVGQQSTFESLGGYWAKVEQDQFEFGE